MICRQGELLPRHLCTYVGRTCWIAGKFPLLATGAPRDEQMSDREEEAATCPVAWSRGTVAEPMPKKTRGSVVEVVGEAVATGPEEDKAEAVATGPEQDKADAVATGPDELEDEDF